MLLQLAMMCPCLAGVGWSRERAMPQGLHLPFGSCAWCLLDPLRATPSYWLIWQHGCDHRCGDGWGAALFFSNGLTNTKSHNEPLDLLFEVCHWETELTAIYSLVCSSVLLACGWINWTRTAVEHLLYFSQILKWHLFKWNVVSVSILLVFWENNTSWQFYFPI